MNVCITDIQTMLIVTAISFIFFEAMLITRKQWFMSFLNSIAPTNWDFTKQELKFGGFMAVNLLVTFMAALVGFISKVIYDFREELLSIYKQVMPIATIFFLVTLGIALLILIKYGLYKLYKANGKNK